MANISLIANSGIQLHAVPMHINFEDCDKNLLFHEWLDDKLLQFNLELATYLRQNKVTIKRSQLETTNFVDEVSGNLKVTENEILSVPNLTILYKGDVKNCDELFYMSGDNTHCKLSELLNHWIPVPYFELNHMGELKLGPYNWCRCKIIPTDITESYLDGTLLLAFDTHATYGETIQHSECPVFDSDSEMDKGFSFCNRPSMILDFCSGENTWVRDAIMELVHHVSDLDDIRTDILRGEHKYDFLATYIWLMDYISKHVEVPEVRLIRDRGVSNIPVEMIIDIGNSRTAAILYEGDFSKVEPLSLQNFDNPIDAHGQLNKADESFDMRVAFQKVDFGYNMIGSQQFIWPSMVRLGSEAQQLTFRTSDLTEGDEIFSTYSSPKRYLWDNKRRKEEWRCVKDENGENERPEIPCISNLFTDDGTIAEDELGYGFHYSRKTLMTLAFLEILAQTDVQINSFKYRSHRGRPSTGRFLDKVILTCPTGMSKMEQRALHNCLRDALYVHGKFYHNYDESYEPNKVSIEPNLEQDSENGQWIYDEATCSQFVYLYGLLTETYHNCSIELFNIYGKKRNDRDSLIIGSLDIGAGTSDIMVCRYDYNPANPSRMKPVPLFWDSFNVAGDDMLQVLISNILLQGKDGLLEKELVNRGEEEETVRAKLFDFFGKDQITHSFIDKNLRRDFNLQILVPLMYEFLKLHSEGESAKNVTYKDVFRTNKPSEAILNKFMTVFGFDLTTMEWHYDRETLSRHIANSMDERLLQKVAGVMAGYGCDLVLLSGRPTSLEPICEAFLSHAPVPTPDRVICLNKYEIGDWYPFIDKAHRRINNSKSIVPIGAMIGYLASNASEQMHGFSLDLSELSRLLKPTTNYFLVNDARVNVNPSFMEPGKRIGEIKTNFFPVFIGSRQFDLGIYPVRPFYVLDVDRDGIANRIKEQEPSFDDQQVQRKTEQTINDLLQEMPLTIVFTRDYREDCETLELDSVKNNLKDELSTDDFALCIQSLNDPDCYWLDSGVFDINRAR